MLNVTIRGQQGAFFDAKIVTNAADKATKKALSKAGAFVRTTAKSSLRYAKKSAMPGQPPKVHRGGSMGYQRTTTNKKTGVSKTRSVSPLKELLFFAYVESSKSVVIGPRDFKGAAKRSYKVPTIMELGGTVVQLRGKKTVTATYKGNPFMRPALAKESPKFAGLFANTVRK
jgi:hypothetical protein